MQKLTTEQKRLKGTLQPCRTNDNEPTPQPGTPIMPKELSKSAKVYWPIVIGHLDTMGTLAVADQHAIAGLCQALGDMRDARKQLVARGGALTYMTVTGAWQAYPELILIDKADKRILSWVTKLGLTPADRSKVSSLKDKPVDEDFGFLN